MKQFISILKPRCGVIALIVLFLALSWIFIVLPVTATEGEELPGNVTCQDLGFAYGFKIDPPGSGLYWIDEHNTVSLSTSDGVYFDWSSTMYMDAVIVKGGPNSLVYRYDPAKNNDTGQHAPIDPINGKPYGLSHVEFCWESPPVIQVTKTANPVEVTEPGGPVAFTVKVENKSQPQDPVTITSLVDDIHGNLDGQGTCSVPQTIQPGSSYECTFTATVSGNTGTSETDTVTASGADDEGTPVSDSDDATVTLIECMSAAASGPNMPNCFKPVIQVTKTADPVQVVEPGGLVTFTVKIDNLSNPTDPVTITSLVDDVYGNLNGKGTCTVGQTIPPGGSYECAFTAMVTGNVGDIKIDVVTALGHDDEGTSVSDFDDATVTIVEPLPVIQVTKTANPLEVYEPGGLVTFTVLVENQSLPQDPVTITSLMDDVYGDLNGKGTCSVPQTIQPGDTYVCAFSAMVSGSEGDTKTDVVTATGADDEGTPVSDFDDATVTVLATRFFVYFPAVSFEPSNPCGSLGRFGVTIGFEDLAVPGPIDYDYNDWITDIEGELSYDPAVCDLVGMDLTFTPQTRGATYDHAFHFRIPPNTFSSGGIATLTVYDQNGNQLSSNQIPFSASADADFTIFPKTSDVFPIYANTFEGTSVLPPGRTAKLSIVFDTPFPFIYSPESLNFPHGEGLFFDPYLHVINWNGNIHTGDFRLLSIPVATYLWPEETKEIFKVYQGITYVPGTPPTLDFVPFWWQLPHNNCVFGDGVVCSFLR